MREQEAHPNHATRSTLRVSRSPYQLSTTLWQWMAKPWSAVVMALVPGGQMNAQVSTHSFSNTTVTYAALSSGTALSGGTTWDDAVQNVTLPFSFWFNGFSYSAVNISTNGFITFGARVPTTATYFPISGSGTYAGAVSVFGRNLFNNGTTVTYCTQDTSPKPLPRAAIKNPKHRTH